ASEPIPFTLFEKPARPRYLGAPPALAGRYHGAFTEGQLFALRSPTPTTGSHDSCKRDRAGGIWGRLSSCSNSARKPAAPARFWTQVMVRPIPDHHLGHSYNPFKNMNL